MGHVNILCIHTPPPLCFKIYYFVRNCLMHTHAWLSQGSKKTATNCSSSSLHTRNGNLGLFLKMLGKVVSSRKYLTLAMLSLQDSSQTKNKILLPYVGWSCPILIFQFWENSKSFMQPCGGPLIFYHTQHYQPIPTFMTPVQITTSTALNQPHSLHIPLVKRALRSESFFPRTTTRKNRLPCGCFPKHYNLKFRMNC